MFFFIGGIQPKTVEIESQPRMCHACGLYQARLKRLDHYLSVFFIPLFPVKKGSPFLECGSCGTIAQEPGDPWHDMPESSRVQCHHCGNPLDAAYRFCPYCGKEVKGPHP